MRSCRSLLHACMPVLSVGGAEATRASALIPTLPCLCACSVGGAEAARASALKANAASMTPLSEHDAFFCGGSKVCSRGWVEDEFAKVGGRAGRGCGGGEGGRKEIAGWVTSYGSEGGKGGVAAGTASGRRVRVAAGTASGSGWTGKTPSCVGVSRVCSREGVGGPRAHFSHPGG